MCVFMYEIKLDVAIVEYYYHEVNSLVEPIMCVTSGRADVDERARIKGISGVKVINERKESDLTIFSFLFFPHILVMFTQNITPTSNHIVKYIQ